MNGHISDELPRLLSGEAAREDVLSAAAHLRICVDCQQELVSAVVAHASLTSAHRFAPEIVSGLTASAFADADHAHNVRPIATSTARSDDLSADADADDAAGNDDADGDGDGAGAGPFAHRVTGEPATGHATLPDLSEMFARVRRELDEPRSAGPRHVDTDTRPSRARRAPTRTRLISVAAAAAVVIGGAGVAAYEVSNSDSGTGGRTVALAAFDKGHTPATAHIEDGTLTVDASSLPQLASQRYEVWLTNAQRTRMQPIGWIATDGIARISLPSDMMKHFDDLEVSVQNPASSDYSYSGTSVLRGSID